MMPIESRPGCRSVSSALSLCITSSRRGHWKPAGPYSIQGDEIPSCWMSRRWTAEAFWFACRKDWA